ncbi:ABC-2 family transporter protein [Anaerosphaera aminiphila DSM 21120]|uniref:ABC-2 family transporter protein n=1 Tax=Anaerosphaera aminiphila DSM 21120 TaxID=1120995 RepID=A0A1M5UQM9_9FIRM|nr:ABC-2 transporter permease [Anaerosphaera aminiphila]SHH65305.1 ABC-2 family transporter protein [Anaerosphaera aminiphila DSM 21120]
MIKSLLYKDIRVYINGMKNSYKKMKTYNIFINVFYLFLMLTGILIGKLNGNLSIFIIVLNLFMFSILTATFNMDQELNAERYLATTPISSLKVVSSKFILLLLISIFNLTVDTIVFFILKSGEGYAFFDYVISVLLLQMIVTLIYSIEIPLIYKFGVQRYLLPFLLSGIGLIIIIALIIFAVLKLFPKLIKIDTLVFAGTGKFIGYILLLTAILSFLIILLGIYILSVRILKNKEY